MQHLRRTLRRFSNAFTQRPMEDLVSTTGSLSLAIKRQHVAIMCDSNQYVMDRNTLAGESDWFLVACNLHVMQRRGHITFPPEKAKYIKALIRYLRSRTYTGPIPELGRHVPEWERNSNTPAGLENGCTIHFYAKNPALVLRFPELKDTYGWTIHGEAAVKACQIITHHADAQSTYLLHSIAASCYTCQLHALPPTVQTALYPYLAELQSRNPSYSADAVFHAQMHKYANKYMLQHLRPYIVTAFRQVVKPWVNTSFWPGESFLDAVKLVWGTRGMKGGWERGYGNEEEGYNVPKGGGVGNRQWGAAAHNTLVDALVDVMACNWGWMEHDLEVMRVLRTREFGELLEWVEKGAQVVRVEWEDLVMI